MKDWYVYIDENGKTRAWDVTKSNAQEIEQTLNEVGFVVVGKVAAKREADAISYTEQVLI